MAELKTAPAPFALGPEINGGILSAVASVPQTIPMGILVFAPFGLPGLSFGITSALLSALVGAIIVALAGPMKVQIAGPRSGSALILAELSLWLAGQPMIAAGGGSALSRALPLILLAVFVAGALQLAAGIFNLARYVKFLPLPVLSGFTLALGIGMMISTWPAWFGTVPGQSDGQGAGSLSHLGMIATFFATLIAFPLAVRAKTKLPPIAVAFLVGLAVAGISHFATGSGTLMHLGFQPVMPHFIVLDLPWRQSLSALADPNFAGIFALFVLALALISSVESLVSLVACDFRTGGDTDAAHEMRAEGVANMANALVGGFTISASIGRTATNIAVGARTALSATIAAVLSGLLLLVPDPVAVMPYPVLEGVLFLIGFALYDGRLGELVRHVLRPSRRRPGQIGDIAVLLATTGATLVFGATIGLTLGLTLSILKFTWEMSRPVIRSVLTGRQRRSRRTRPPQQAEYLFAHGTQTVIADLEGTMFFGTADQVRRWLLTEALASPRSIIINLGSIFDIDATGAGVLAQAVQRVAATSSVAVAFSGLPAQDERRLVLHEMRLDRSCPFFDDLDAALEWAEDRILAAAPATIQATPDRQIPLADQASPHQIQNLEKYLAYRVIDPGDVIFRQGDDGDALYFLEEGAIRIEWSDGARTLRLATLTPGVVFGEMSLIDGAPRSATARAEERSVILKLDKDNLDYIIRENPQLAIELLRGLASDMARRLRLANAALAEVSS